MLRTTAILTTLALAATSASAETLRWSRTGDALTLDPHAQNEGPTATLIHQIAEPLVIRDIEGVLEPALATEWSVNPDDPNIWTFKLREGVTFHDGAEFTADDVVFSFERAKSGASNYKELLTSITEIRAVDDYTVEFVTDGPNPILPANFTNLFVMDRGWAEANDAVEVQDFASGETTFAATNINGTGPYRLVSREADVSTVLEANPDYWGVGEFPLGFDRIEFRPIQNAATRVAALLSGEVDFIQDVPVQDLARVDGTEGLVVKDAPQNRTIFFGMNVGAEDLARDDVEGANPLADVRVRRAMDLAIDRAAIQQVVMRGQSVPTGVIAPPFVDGWTPELDVVREPDVEAARALLAEAGYPDGFTIQLDCPNDRYVNDEAICQAVAGMLGQIGIEVNLNAQSRSLHFPLVQNSETDFYLLGWGVPTYDSEYIFNFLVHTKDGERGSWNPTGFSDPELDAKIQSLASETDLAVREATVAEIWAEVQEQQLYLPIHHQILNWGMTDAVGTEVYPEDDPKFKHFTLN